MNPIVLRKNRHIPNTKDSLLELRTSKQWFEQEPSSSELSYSKGYEI